MIHESTFVFVLALFALALGGAALTISWTSARALDSWRSRIADDLLRHDQRISQQNESVSSALRELAGQTPAKLAAEVGALSEAVARVAETHRKFAGKVWSIIGERRAPEAPAANGADDPELAALLALQSSQR